MGDLLGADYALVEKNALYRCLDKVLPYKAEVFDHLRQRWQDLFGARFDVLLYDLTSTYFESDARQHDPRRHEPLGAAGPQPREPIGARLTAAWRGLAWRSPTSFDPMARRGARPTPVMSASAN